MSLSNQRPVNPTSIPAITVAPIGVGWRIVPPLLARTGSGCRNSPSQATTRRGLPQ